MENRGQTRENQEEDEGKKESAERSLKKLNLIFIQRNKYTLTQNYDTTSKTGPPV